MSDIRTITITGNLGGNAEIRNAGEGVVTSFSVASKQGWGDNERTLWFKCSMWGKRGEKIAQYLLKGSAVTVTGEFTKRKWNDREGLERESDEIRVNEVKLPPRQREGATGNNQRRDEPAPGHKAAPDDDIPF